MQAYEADLIFLAIADNRNLSHISKNLEILSNINLLAENWLIVQLSALEV